MYRVLRTGAGELVGWMVNETSLTAGSVALWWCRTVGVETRVYNKLVELEWFLESERGRFGEEVLGC